MKTHWHIFFYSLTIRRERQLDGNSNKVNHKIYCLYYHICNTCMGINMACALAVSSGCSVDILLSSSGQWGFWGVTNLVYTLCEVTRLVAI